MRLAVPLRPDPRAPLARANPVAKLGAAALLLLVLFVSVDPLTPLLVLVVVAASIPLTGLRASHLVARAWPLLLAAVLVGVLNVIFAASRGGLVALRIGPIEVEAAALVSGLALSLRLLAIALSGMLALVSTDPTDLADALQQQLRLPARIAVGVLAALRLLPILAEEWQTLALARRARGVAADGSPLTAVRIASGQLLALLVLAVRRGSRLATAMDARGFGSRACRTIARPQRMRAADWALLAGAAVVGAGAVLLSVALGSWRFLLGA